VHWFCLVLCGHLQTDILIGNDKVLQRFHKV
jgi:hypothetical protein